MVTARPSWRCKKALSSTTLRRAASVEVVEQRTAAPALDHRPSAELVNVLYGLVFVAVRVMYLTSRRSNFRSARGGWSDASHRASVSYRLGLASTRPCRRLTSAASAFSALRTS